MENNKKIYLQSLLAWADEIESKLNRTGEGVSKGEINDWLSNLTKWKMLIKNTLEENEHVSDEFIYNIQTKSQALIDSLKSIIEKDRNELTSLQPGEHQLPPLPYAYDALEPYISQDIMKLHHKKHHQSYVDGLNNAEKELYIKKPDSKLIKHWLREQAFNGSGHYLHTIFWNNMSPKGGGTPGNVLLSQMKKDFGSLKNFQQLFSKAAASVEGVGWAILLWQPRAGRLGIQTVEKHQMFSLWDSVPLLVLDVWEHAYYLQYENDRASYINNWWNVVNWSHVEERFDNAKQLIWPLY
ncbi:superoxide dismutase [Aquibacillus rhizosphaerae]|uniref:superoxide dismutase n=1 Tax=Aquibacillus rhizosphaerae TaxID=3051431 RepID=A0ABT7L4F4_9BACI|nr:superoxide dismutase [Aquibacillus sp. LR5S19]MDL4840752.1 superoxide dismutase [Aquibacillus sp. LR5S19]